MSDKKQKEPSQVTIGTFKRSHKTVMGIVLGGILVVVVVAIGYEVWHQHTLNNQKKAAQAHAATVFNQTTDATTKDLNSNNPTGAISQLNYSLTQPLSVDQKALTLSRLGQAYIMNSQIDKGLSSLLSAEKLDPQVLGSTIYALMASVYEQKGDKTNAILYYKKAITAARADTTGGDLTYVPSYQSNIKRLGGTP